MNMNSNQSALCQIIIVIICAIIAITGFLTLWSENKILTSNNELLKHELLKNELREFNTTEISPARCIKCVCNNICQEAINETKGDE